MASRGHFSNKFGFIAAAAGSAVGLGNIWKFPFEVGDGGGAAFLIVYLIFCFVLCYPILISEVSIGRKSESSVALSFQKLGFKKWSFIGYLGVFCGILILSFYNVVAAWVLGYFVEMLKGNFEIGRHFTEFTSDVSIIAFYTILFLTFTALIVSRGVTKGIEKASKLLMPILIFIMLLLVAYAMTLPNAMKGIEFYLIPDFSKLNLKVIYKALGQSFFSLSLGMGALITYGSYLSKKEDIVQSGAIITLADVGIAFLAGLMIFPFVFYQGIEPSGGAGLIFMTMPGIFQSMGDFWGIAIGSMFFLLLAFAALTSTISLFEIPVAFFVDRYNLKRKTAVWIAAAMIFLIGLPSMLSNGYSETLTNFVTYWGAENPSSFMTLVSDVSSDTLLPLGGFLVSIFVVYIWKRKSLFNELNSGAPEGAKRHWIYRYVGFSLSYIAPVVLGTIFVLTILEKFLGVQVF